MTQNQYLIKRKLNILELGHGGHPFNTVGN